MKNDNAIGPNINLAFNSCCRIDISMPSSSDMDIDIDGGDAAMYDMDVDITINPLAPFSGPDYNNLRNKPSINGVTLESNKTSEEIGVIGAPSNPSDGDYLVYSSGEWIAAILQTDKTLTQSDKAAEAKAAGDAINSIESTIDFSATTELWPSVDDWEVGYVNITDIKHSSSNYDIVGKKAIKVNAGEIINVNLCYALASDSIISPYCCYAWCSDEIGTHLSTDRFVYTGRWTRMDENYKYYETTIIVPDGAQYFILSYRDYNENPALSSVTINRAIANAVLPSGGNTGQVLKKISDFNYDVEWADESNLITIDSTLTHSGEAAEAKAAGDAINEVKNVIGFSSVTTPWPTINDWEVGYVDATNIKHTASNNGIVGKKAVKVNAGEIINVNLCFAPSSSEVTSPYLYYAWCSDKIGTHLSTDRVTYTGRYSSIDENYKYYTTTITVPNGANYFIMSYRDYNNNPMLSSITISRATSDLDDLKEAQEITEVDVAELKMKSWWHLFPDNLELPICVAHRGIASAGVPENTIPAYEDAISKGWRYLETDLLKTADDVWVLSHDDVISGSGGNARNPDGTVISDTVKISETDYEDLLEYDFTCGNSEYAGTKIATLKEFLLLCRRSYVHPLIHVKDSAMNQTDADAVWAIVEECEMENQIIWGGSSLGCVSRFLEKNPYAPAVNFASATYEYIDPNTFPSLDTPYVAKYMTGKNKVFHQRDAGKITSKSDMDNFVDYYHYFGIGAGVYGPTTEVSVGNLCDRLDIVTTEKFFYDKAPKPYSSSNPPPYPVTSVNRQTGDVTLSIPSVAQDINAIAAPTNAVEGDFLVYNSGEWTAATPSENPVLPSISSANEGQVLTASNSEWISRTAEFIVNINYENNAYSANKTFSAIAQAAIQGQVIVALYGGAIYYHTGTMDNAITYRNFVRITTNTNGNKIADIFSIRNTNAVTREKYTLGSYSLPSTGIPKIDLEISVQSSLNKADTALQSFTETDPTVPSWAKESSKPSYDFSEINAKPSTISGYGITDAIEEIRTKNLLTQEWVALPIINKGVNLPEVSIPEEVYYPTFTIDELEDELVVTDSSDTPSEIIGMAMLNDKVIIAKVSYNGNVFYLPLSEAREDQAIWTCSFAGEIAEGIFLRIQSDELSWTVSMFTAAEYEVIEIALNDLSNTINSKYTKPETGIPKSDLTSAVQSSLDAAISAPPSPSTGDLLQWSGSSWAAASISIPSQASDIGAYSKPSTGIPSSDFEEAVQSLLGLAGTALQSAPVTSVNGQTGVVSLSIPSNANDVGAIPSDLGNYSNGTIPYYYSGQWLGLQITDALMEPDSCRFIIASVNNTTMTIDESMAHFYDIMTDLRKTYIITDQARVRFYQIVGYDESTYRIDLACIDEGKIYTVALYPSGQDYNQMSGTIIEYNPASKLDVAQGSAHAGEFVVVGSDGNITTIALSSWQGGTYGS